MKLRSALPSADVHRSLLFHLYHLYVFEFAVS
jgi:hypothetical protein